MSDRSTPLLDRPAARFVALGVVAAALGALAWIHRGDLVPGAATVAKSPRETAFLQCFEPRSRQIADSLAAGDLRRDQAVLFRNRASDFCRAQVKRDR